MSDTIALGGNGRPLITGKFKTRQQLVQFVIEEYKATGKGYKTISREAEISASSAKGILLAHGIEIDQKPVTHGRAKTTGPYDTREELELEVVFLRSDRKMTYTAIAKELGIDTRTVRTIYYEYEESRSSGSDESEHDSGDSDGKRTQRANIRANNERRRKQSQVSKDKERLHLDKVNPLITGAWV